MGCLVMFTFGVMVIKMLKMDYFLYFLLMAAKSQSVWAKYLSTSGRSYLALLENAMDYWVLAYHVLRCQPLKIQSVVFSVDSVVF